MAQNFRSLSEGKLLSEQNIDCGVRGETWGAAFSVAFPFLLWVLLSTTATKSGLSDGEAEDALPILVITPTGAAVQRVQDGAGPERRRVR